MLEAKGLRRSEIPLSLLQNPSPGSIQPTRFALQVSHDASSCSAYIASGSSVYEVQISMEDCIVDRGKESLLIPVHAEVIDFSVANLCPHRTEIQSIELLETGSGQLILGSVDSYGCLVVSKLNVDDGQSLTFSASPQDWGVGEGSWTGLSFSPNQWSLAAVARSFCRSIDIYDHEMHLRTLRTLWYPSSVTFVQSQFHGTESSILAITEGCQLTLWDLRIKENGGCLQRICGSPGDILYAVDVSSRGNIAVGGTDRTVTLYDPRRWSAVSRLVNCSKYEITGLAFSSVDSNHIYIQGVDYEVLCHHWPEGKKKFSYRGDSNWLGFSKAANQDVLGGWCDSGSIFVAAFANAEEGSTTSGQSSK